jgi:hypothetical protein
MSFEWCLIGPNANVSLIKSVLNLTRRYQCYACEDGLTATQSCLGYVFNSPHAKACDQGLLSDLLNKPLQRSSMSSVLAKRLWTVWI